MANGKMASKPGPKGAKVSYRGPRAQEPLDPTRRLAQRQTAAQLREQRRHVLERVRAAVPEAGAHLRLEAIPCPERPLEQVEIDALVAEIAEYARFLLEEMEASAQERPA